MKVSVVNAYSDLGLDIDGSSSGPTKLKPFEKNCTIYDVECLTKEKERSKDNKKKNLKALNQFNEKLYKTILGIDDFVITVGGDHSVAIASALASKKKNGNIGIIWIDAHADFNTFDTTVSGNIHGMPYATVTFNNGKELTNFYDGDYYNTQNAVLIGARDIEEEEYINLKRAGIKLFTMEDIKKEGIEEIMKKAIKIATKDTIGMHISFDIDVIDKKFVKGVSTPVENGINFEEAKKIIAVLLSYRKQFKSLDLVEFNPSFDIDNKTLKIAKDLLEQTIKGIS